MHKAADAQGSRQGIKTSIVNWGEKYLGKNFIFIPE
jgi:hypothetical protein